MKPAKPMMKSTGKVAPSKPIKSSTKTSSKSKMSAYGSKNPIGPQTKKEAKVKSIPPYTQSKSVEVKAAKKKQLLKNAASIGGSIIGTAAMIASDARLTRGKNRYYNENEGNMYAPNPTIKQKWGMGKNKKSTKK